MKANNQQEQRNKQEIAFLLVACLADPSTLKIL
jgi:hypothetical protein